MTPPNKPEWIELADADSAPEVKKVTRALPALVLAAALSIVGVGILFAQNGTEAPASAEVQTMAASSTPSASSDPVTPKVAKTLAVTTAPKQPGIAAMPTRGGDDGDDGDDEDDEGEGREGHGDRGNHESDEGDDD
jgi:hypothetical protein